MGVLAHLSDLHLGADSAQQPDILQSLPAALASAPRRPDVLLVSGDVFDTSAPGPAGVERLVHLLDALEQQLGGPRPTLLMPGNHDRRESGVFAPWSRELFDTLRERLADRPHVHVLGGRGAIDLVPLPALGVDFAAWDSTRVRQGFLSAGGLVQAPDLLQLAARLEGRDPARPLVVALHHHLVPTPVTDTSPIDTSRRGWLTATLVRRVLPKLVAFGDREELTMTALGAGTALSLLHQLGRPVVVLHGHKHVPAVRLLPGLVGADADVLLASAGSCGTSTAWGGGDFDESPRLWPSFNLVTFERDEVRLEEVAWSPWEKGRINPPRPLAHVRREGARLHPLRGEGPGRPAPTVLALNEARLRLLPSRGALGRYDVEVERTVRALPQARMAHTWEVIPGLPGARVVDASWAGRPLPEQPTPTRLKLPRDGTGTFRVLGGALAPGGDGPDNAAPGYGQVGFLNRSWCALARLVVELPPGAPPAFGSALELATGRERPLPLVRDGARLVAEVRDCAARTLLRAWWPLDGVGPPS